MATLKSNLVYFFWLLLLVPEDVIAEGKTAAQDQAQPEDVAHGPLASPTRRRHNARWTGAQAAVQWGRRHALSCGYYFYNRIKQLRGRICRVRGFERGDRSVQHGKLR